MHKMNRLKYKFQNKKSIDGSLGSNLAQMTLNQRLQNIENSYSKSNNQAMSLYEINNHKQSTNKASAMSQTPHYNAGILQNSGRRSDQRRIDTDTMVDDQLYINQYYDKLNGSTDSKSNINNMKIRK